MRVPRAYLSQISGKRGNNQDKEKVFLKLKKTETLKKFWMRNGLFLEKQGMTKVDKNECKTRRILVAGKWNNYLNKQEEASARMWQTGNCHALLM